MWFPYALMAGWLLELVGALWFTWLFQSRIGTPAGTETEPPVTVVTPIKGAGPHLAPFLARLRLFSYSDYRIVAVVESEHDPALPHLRRAAAAPGPPLTIEIAGLSDREGQKVHNLRHALAGLDDRTAIVAFIDADTLPETDWLPRLVRPLIRDPAVAAVTGYRWIVPDDARLASAVVAAANTSIVTLPRIWNICWGGTLALRRSTIDAIDLSGRLKGSVVDDVQITRILRDEGLRILTPRGLVVRSPVRHDWRSAFAFARRQYLFVRWYLPGSWAAALALLTLPVAASLVTIVLAAQGDRIAIVLLCTILLLGQVRAGLRASVARRLWGSEGDRLYRRQRVADRFLAPLWIGFHAAALWSTFASRRLRWSGTVYDVRGRTDVRVVQRDLD